MTQLHVQPPLLTVDRVHEMIADYEQEARTAATAGDQIMSAMWQSAALALAKRYFKE
ncbi:hypothetical protein [Saccharopolyspora mangrovi]|uniref:Uncharacterized protein n=1 Tax=Saccharopolyspora mangrovi TaxID=3082379 RepID=A0ABU6A789_9PSEU|nr:hypothetical protein [Saccharopolyspora sp. S2-29]MEB3367434.1 hypothetical protein [Saccharopolyspora sp. S2-29]